MTVTFTHTPTGQRATLPDGRWFEGSLTAVRAWVRRRTRVTGTVVVTEARAV